MSRNLEATAASRPGGLLPEGEPEPTIIRSSSGWNPLNLDEVWAHRELVLFIVRRTLAIRYKQTALGAGWAIIQPLFTMAVFSVFLGHLARVPSDGLPYPLFVLAGLLPWQLFAFAVTEASFSLTANPNLIAKVYLPRLVLPIAATLPGLLDFGFAFLVLVVMMIFYRAAPSGWAWLLPLFVLLTLVAGLAIGLWLAVLNVRYRDVRYALPFLIQCWLFATPIAYPSSLLPEAWRPFYGLNPLAGVIEGFRWALLGVGQPPGAELLVSTGVILVLLFAGALFFRRQENSFADDI